MLLYHRLQKLRDIARGMSVGPLKYVLVNLTNISVARFQEGFLDVFKVRKSINLSSKNRKLPLKELAYKYDIFPNFE